MTGFAAVARRWLWLLAFTVAACGGGGGGSEPSPTATQVPATATFTVPPTATQVPPTATVLPTALPTDVPTQVPTDVPTPVPTATLAPTNTVEPTATEAVPTPTEIETATPTESPVPTATPLVGPVITAFGIADSSGSFNGRINPQDPGLPVFRSQTGQDFIIYIEARTGVSGLPIATNLLSTLLDDPSGQPDLQLVSSQALGDGSAAVCDRSFPSAGGIPAVEPADFSFAQPISDALNDFACRFRIFTEPDFACTQDNNGNLTFANRGSVLQFCTLVNESFKFPSGDTVLTARVRDTAGKAGPPAQIIVRVGS